MNSKFLPILATCIGGCLIGLAPIFVRFSEIGPSLTGSYRFVFATTLILIYGLILKSNLIFFFSSNYH